MKIVYCINGLYNSGGMERILTEKANYLLENYNYDIDIITTDQKNKENFYKLNEKINCIDLNINYIDDLKKSFFKRVFGYLNKQKKHEKKLEKVINDLKPDILISLGCEDRNFLYKLKTKNIKVIREYHFNKKYMLQDKKKNFLYILKGYYRYIKEILLINKYDEVIVLTKEDKEQWNNKKVKVIPNFINYIPKEVSNCKNKKIISVGRLEYQKGYDILIEVWNIISKEYPDWILEIYGEGPERENLQNKVNKLGLGKSFLLKGAVKNIQDKYLESSIYVMSSRFEGMPMVLLEAMSFGLPVVSFTCPCGPKDIIKNNEDGFLVDLENIEKMAEKIKKLIVDEEKRILFGKNAQKNIQRFSKNKIMKDWKKLFSET